MKKFKIAIFAVHISLSISSVMAADALPIAPVVATGSSWFLNKTITPTPIPKNSDSSKQGYGQDYYPCGGAANGEGSQELTILTLRKGLKTKCNPSNLTVALVKFSNNGKTVQFFDVMDIKVPKGHEFISYGCTNGVVTLTNIEEDVERYTRHLKAWIVKDNKFFPVTNLKNISCENISFGA